jgi:Clp amino terminal domain.
VIRVTVLEAKSLKSGTVESEHLMLSILKNKENIATQILMQYEVDYDVFKNELGVLLNSDFNTRAEYSDDDNDDFEEEKKGSGYGAGASKQRQQQGGAQKKQNTCARQLWPRYHPPGRARHMGSRLWGVKQR